MSTPRATATATVRYTLLMLVLASGCSVLMGPEVECHWEWVQTTPETPIHVVTATDSTIPAPFIITAHVSFQKRVCARR